MDAEKENQKEGVTPNSICSGSTASSLCPEQSESLRGKAFVRPSQSSEGFPDDKLSKEPEPKKLKASIANALAQCQTGGRLNQDGLKNVPFDLKVRSEGSEVQKPLLKQRQKGFSGASVSFDAAQQFIYEVMTRNPRECGVGHPISNKDLVCNSCPQSIDNTASRSKFTKSEQINAHKHEGFNEKLNRLVNSKKGSDEKIVRLRSQQERKELKQCTFKPEIRPYDRISNIRTLRETKSSQELQIQKCTFKPEICPAPQQKGVQTEVTTQSESFKANLQLQSESMATHSHRTGSRGSQSELIYCLQPSETEHIMSEKADLSPFNETQSRLQSCIKPHDLSTQRQIFQITSSHIKLMSRIDVIQPKLD